MIGFAFRTLTRSKLAKEGTFHFVKSLVSRNCRLGACDSVVVKELCYKSEGRGFYTP
jgi:hypothetical protein